MKRRLGVMGIAAFVLTFLLDIIFLDPHHVELWWHKVPGFDIIFGFIGCVAIIIVSKWLGKHFLQRHERYYEGR
ncbi:MAG: hypothetical protein PWP65_867 [Clostridia bacterium]|nr:hypothetical protein [Clostridia bacterium]